ncbi:MAG: FAD-dependent oxidoreductase [Leptospiraceae bacterium]|nr:FAD-dependent oxidoreductase [Leptospiraceae bacterium]
MLNKQIFINNAWQAVALILLPGMLAFSCRDQVQSQTRRPKVEVVVVGGGIAGLSAAVNLKKEGYDVLLLEKNAYAGGRTLSGSHNGFRYAKGTEYLGQPESDLQALIQYAGITLREIPYPVDAHWQQGQFWYADDGIARMLIEKSDLKTYNRFVSTIQKLGRQYVEAPDFRKDSPLARLDTISAYDWFQSEGFDGIYIEKYNVACRGLFGANMREISALSFIPEIAFDYEDAKPIKSIKDVENKIQRKGSYSSDTYSFSGGIADLTEALASKLGAAVQFNSTVISIQPEEDELRVFYTRPNGEKSSVLAESVVLATPATVSLQLAGQLLTNEERQLMQQISYAEYITVSFFTKEPVWDKSFDLSIEDDFFFTDVYDATWTQRHYDSKVKDRTESIMTVYIGPRSYHDSLVKMSDQTVLARTLTDLKKVFGADIEAKLSGHDIQRFASAYPVMTKGAYQRLSRLNYLNGERDNGLFLAGDYLVYPTFEAAVDSGATAADLVDDWMQAD